MISLMQTTKAKSLLKLHELWSIKKWALNRVRSFLISYVEFNLNEELTRYFTNGLLLLDRKSPPTIKNICVIMKACSLIKSSNVIGTVTLKLENVIRPSAVPYYLFLNKCVI